MGQDTQHDGPRDGQRHRVLTRQMLGGDNDNEYDACQAPGPEPADKQLGIRSRLQNRAGSDTPAACATTVRLSTA